MNPPTPVWRTGVSPQHFTCLAVSGDSDLLVRSHVGARSAFVDPSSHPLESNQNLPGFSRARRPTTQERDTRCATTLIAQRSFHRCPCQGTTSSKLFNCQRCPFGTLGAHLGPRCLRDSRGRTCRDSLSELRSPDHESQNCRSELAPDGRPENADGPLGRSSPGRPITD